MKHVPLPMRLRGVIFDCDGVIIDSREANAHYYNSILAEMGLGPLTAAQESFTYMSTVREALAHITPEHLQYKLPEICAHSVNYMRDIMPMVQMEIGFMDFVHLLHGKGVRCAVHTNRSSGMADVMNTFALHSYFDPVVTANIVRPKPAPDGVAYVLAQWAMPAHEVLFVGDSSHDAHAAHAGGVAFVAYRNAALPATLSVAHYSELTEVLAQALFNASSPDHEFR